MSKAFFKQGHWLRDYNITQSFGFSLTRRKADRSDIISPEHFNPQMPDKYLFFPVDPLIHGLHYKQINLTINVFGSYYPL